MIQTDNMPFTRGFFHRFCDDLSDIECRNLAVAMARGMMTDRKTVAIWSSSDEERLRGFLSEINSWEDFRFDPDVYEDARSRLMIGIMSSDDPDKGLDRLFVGAYFDE